MVIPGIPGVTFFWEAEQAGARVTLAKGRAGEPLTRWSRTFASAAEAAAHLERGFEARRAEGYVDDGDAVVLREPVAPMEVSDEARETANGIIRENVQLLEGAVATTAPFTEVLQALFQHDKATTIKSLEVDRERGADEMGFSALIRVIMASAPASLERLLVGTGPINIDKLCTKPLGDCDPLFDLPLRTLVLQGTCLRFGVSAPSTLEHLELRTLDLDTRDLAVLFGGAFTSLVTLKLWLGPGASQNKEPPEDEQITVAALEPLFDGRLFPNLKHLGLQNMHPANQLCEAILSSSLLPQLSTLDFSFGTMTDAGAAVLAAGRDKLAHLTRLDVSQNGLSAIGCLSLEGAAKVVSAGGQRPGNYQVVFGN